MSGRDLVWVLFFFLIENNEFDVVVFGLKTVRFTYVGCAVVALVHGV